MYTMWVMREKNRKAPSTKRGLAERSEVWGSLKNLLPPDRRWRSPGKKSSKCNRRGEENFGWGEPTEAFSGARIKQMDNKIYMFRGSSTKIAALREEETQQAVGVLVCSTLPWFVRLGKINQSMEFGFQSPEFSEF